MVADRALRTLGRALRGRIETDAAARARVAGDGSHLRGAPLARVVPADADDVVALVRWARRHRIGLVPRGAGTSLDGESVPADGTVVVDLGPWDRILEISASGRWARVQPGVVNGRLQEAVAPLGLFYPPNPGSWRTSTIGGNVGTNASGPRSFRYGATRRWIRAVEVVLGTGERLRLGSRAEKRSVGPDLLGLLVGSEGTLGIVTEVTVRLAPTPPVRWGLVVPLPGRVRLGRVATALAAAPATGLAAVEYLDPYSAAGLAAARGAGWGRRGALLLLEVEADRVAEARARVARIRTVLRRVGVAAAVRRFPGANRLWDLRGESGRVMDERLGERIREDVAVPPDRLDGMLAAVRGIARAERVPLHTFAHLGEGSLHPNLVVDPASPRAERIRAALYAAALDRDGTISGEHGVGRLKRSHLAREIGPVGIRLLRAVRQACDPDGILNPGKLYPL